MFNPTYSLLEIPTFPVSCTMGVYGLGWNLGTYRENSFLFHSGNSFGFTAMVMLYPDLDVGIFVVTNNDLIRQKLWLLIWTASDLFLGYTPWLNSTTVCTYPCPFNCPNNTHNNHNNHNIEQPSKENHSEAMAALRVSDYVGNYWHPTYGTIAISEGAPASLHLRWNDRASGNLTQISTSPSVPDIFTTNLTAIFFASPTPFSVQFFRNGEGIVDSLAIPFEPTVAPILFTSSRFDQLQQRGCGYAAQPIYFNHTIIQVKKDNSSNDTLLIAVVVLAAGVVGLALVLIGAIILGFYFVRKTATSIVIKEELAEESHWPPSEEIDSRFAERLASRPLKRHSRVY